MPHRSLDALVAQRSSSQHGLITRRQALALGLTPRQIHWRLSRGTWVAVEPSVYRVAGAPHTWMTRVLAPCLSTGGLASHRSAAVLWEIGGIKPGIPEITVDRAHRYVRHGVRVHESRDLELAGAQIKDGVPVTGVARTLVDLGAVVTRPVVEDATIDALDRRLITWPKLLGSFLRHARQGRDGVGALRWVIERNLEDAMPQSRLEQRFERVVRAGCLLLPERQVEIADGDGFIGRVDFCFRAVRVIVELDGRAVHARRRAFSKDHDRRNRLSLAGWTVLVFTWEQVVGEPDKVLALVAKAVGCERAAA